MWGLKIISSSHIENVFHEHNTEFVYNTYHKRKHYLLNPIDNKKKHAIRKSNLK